MGRCVLSPVSGDVTRERGALFRKPYGTLPMRKSSGRHSTSQLLPVYSERNSPSKRSAVRGLQERPHMLSLIHI
eukprot:1301494-Prymnesium_polylepis.1